MHRYRLVGHFALRASEGVAVRIAAAALRGWTAAGEPVSLGSPTISLGGGWRLVFPPLLSEVEGRVNKRFIASRLVLRGVDLDRLAGVWLCDAEGEEIYPIAVDRISPRRIELTIGNTAVDEGPCDLCLQDPSGRVQRFARAITAAYLDEVAPGDTNRGAKPERPE
ncbi:MAG: hypothetical protein GF330_03340 [Candidatus Eisenbacteria bacterium]|nr:hypothetical protein [Candidatus Eisenbacteria bacterium]